MFLLCAAWFGQPWREEESLALHFTSIVNREQKSLSRNGMSWEAVKRPCRELHGDMCDEQVWTDGTQKKNTREEKFLIFFCETWKSDFFSPQLLLHQFFTKLRIASVLFLSWWIAQLRPSVNASQCMHQSFASQCVAALLHNASQLCFTMRRSFVSQCVAALLHNESRLCFTMRLLKLQTQFGTVRFWRYWALFVSFCGQQWELVFSSPKLKVTSD